MQIKYRFFSNTVYTIYKLPSFPISLSVGISLGTSESGIVVIFCDFIGLGGGENISFWDGSTSALVDSISASNFSKEQAGEVTFKAIILGIRTTGLFHTSTIFDEEQEEDLAMFSGK